LQESFSAAAQARRIGESKIISAKAEVDSAKLMREAADILSAPSAMQIRYLETLTALSKAPRTKVVFLPSDSGSNQPVITGGHGSSNLSPLQAQNYLNVTNN
jgi:regulator of protease activity HflC (stomatin/prohibitin superfamily)